MGEMADELLFSSTRVDPRRLREADFTFKHKTLASALESELGASAA
jgi:NAD dependent epimerase/dehydratase family enzyme